MSREYVYQPLKRKNNFRILHLEPGEDESDVRFFLTEHCIDGDEEYFALSYVWGAAEYGKRIHSSQGSLTVTQNLYSALKRYRGQHGLVRMWVDAICINQADLAERASQILLMNTIYSCCKGVLVWLGESTPPVERAIRYVTQILDDILPRLVNQSDNTAIFRPALEELLDGLQNESYAEDLTALFEKPWFLRAWTYQEIFSAPSAIFSCGTLSIDSSFLFNLASIWVRYVPRSLWGSQRAIEAISQMSLCRYNQERYYESSQRPSFLDLIGSVRMRQCKDPRDKIYAVISLAYQSQLPYQPSYTVSSAQLYRDFAMHHITATKSLKIFNYCQPNDSNPGLPSWVPDWMCPKRIPAAIDLHDGLFKASGSGPASAVVLPSEEESKLLLRGLLVDEIIRLSSSTHLGEDKSWKNEEQRWASLFAEQHRLVKETADLAVQSMRICEGQSDAYWRAFICDQDDGAQRATQIWRERVKIYRSLILETRGDWKNWAIRDSTDENWRTSIEVETRFVHVATGRRFCLTKNGRLGWVPQEAQVGDIVSILFGSTVPVLLRAVSSSFKLVGQCYIHGLMDGEGIVGGSLLETQSISLV